MGPQQRIEVNRSMSYSENNEYYTTDQTVNSILEMNRSASTTSPSLVPSFVAGSIFTDDLDDIIDNHHNDDFRSPDDDLSRISEVSHATLHLSALNLTLKK